MQKRIFLSYRRDDSAGQSGRIRDRLVRDFGDDYLFMDVDGIPLGSDFVARLNDEVAKCDVLLAVIGRQWIDLRDASGQRRVDNPNDFVRVEISAALQRDIPLIPLLLDGTIIPARELLPDDIKGLSSRNALDVRHSAFHADMDRLVSELKQLFRTTETSSIPIYLVALLFGTLGVISGYTSDFLFSKLTAELLRVWYPDGEARTIPMPANVFRFLTVTHSYTLIASCSSLVAIVLFRNTKNLFWPKQGTAIGFFSYSITIVAGYYFYSNIPAGLSPTMAGTLFCLTTLTVGLASAYFMRRLRNENY